LSFFPFSVSKSTRHLKLTFCDNCDSSSDDEAAAGPSNLNTIHETSEESSSDSSSTSSTSSSSISTITLSSSSRYLSYSADNSKTSPSGDDGNWSSDTDENGGYEISYREQSSDTLEGLSIHGDVSWAMEMPVDDNLQLMLHQQPTNFTPDPVEAAPNSHRYHFNKTLTQILLNFALIAANVNQLKYLLQTQRDNPIFYFNVSLIAASLVIQLIIKIVLCINCRYNITNHLQFRKAELASNIATILILLITVINVTVTGIVAAELWGFL